MTPETTVTKHSTADIRFMPAALSETHNFLTAPETGTKLVFTSAAMRETGSKSTSQNSFQETVLEGTHTHTHTHITNKQYDYRKDRDRRDDYYSRDRDYDRGLLYSE